MMQTNSYSNRNNFFSVSCLVISISLTLPGFAFAISSGPTDSAEVLFGMARFHHGPEGSIFVFVYPYQPDGRLSDVFSTAYLFQTESDRTYLVPSSLRDVRIIARSKSLEFSSNGEELIFLLENEPAEEERYVNVIWGYGLARYCGIRVSPQALICGVYPESCSSTNVFALSE
jgi:hypothetical protein